MFRRTVLVELEKDPYDVLPGSWRVAAESVRRRDLPELTVPSTTPSDAQRLAKL